MASKYVVASFREGQRVRYYTDTRHVPGKGGCSNIFDSSAFLRNATTFNTYEAASDWRNAMGLNSYAAVILTE